MVASNFLELDWGGLCVISPSLFKGIKRLFPGEVFYYVPFCSCYGKYDLSLIVDVNW